MTTPQGGEAEVPAVVARGPHFVPDELRRIVEVGFEDPGRRSQALLHFGSGCRRCQAGLATLARVTPIEGTATAGRRYREGAPPPPPPSGGWDPAALALRDRLDCLRSGQAVHLRAAHRHAIEVTFNRALGFHRAFVESGRQIALEHPRHALPVLCRTLEDLEQQGEDTFPGPRALVFAFLAAAWQTIPDDHEAGKHFRTSERLAAASRDRETRATVKELHADFLQARGDHRTAFRYLDEAAELLGDCVIADRIEEHRVRRGIALMRAGRGREAIEVFTETLATMPEGTRPRLRLQAMHRRIKAEVECGELDDALWHLLEAEELYRDHEADPENATGLMAAQRHRYLGVCYLGLQDFEPAELHLRKALGIYYNLERWIGAAHTLTGLGQLYLIQGRREDLELLEESYIRILQTRESRDLVLEGLHLAIRLAKGRGLPVTLLLELLRALEDERRGVVH